MDSISLFEKNHNCDGFQAQNHVLNKRKNLVAFTVTCQEENGLVGQDFISYFYST